MTEPRLLEEVVAELRARRAVLDIVEAELRSAKQAVAETEDELLTLMNAQGISRVSSQGLTIGITTSIVPQIRDWPSFVQYLLQNGATHLIERRIHTTAWREELEARQGDPIPGIEQYPRIRLSVRTD